ncbi:hypothetical protein GGI21_002675, partial [Coemansia aciculifera]
MHAPTHGVVGVELDPVTVTLERLDPYGTPLGINETLASGIVVHVGLTSEDGTIDYDLTETGERLLVGTTVRTSEVRDEKLVVSFESLVVRRSGVFRFRIRTFDMRDFRISSSREQEEGQQQQQEVTHVPLSSESLYTDISTRLHIYETAY